MMQEPLIEAYGYLAIFVGAFLEGETIIAMGGFAAQRGYLDLPKVVVVGLFGGFLGDQLYFFLGRRHGSDLLARFPGLTHQLKQGAVRETREESGYTFLPTHLVGIYQYYYSATQTIYLRLAYTGPVFAPEGPLTHPTDPSIHAAHWLTYEQLDRARERHRSPFVMQ